MAAGSLGWFARHEMRLAWRDWLMMVQGGRRGRGVGAAIAITLFIVVLHLVAYTVLKPSATLLLHPDKGVFLTLTGSAFLAWALLLSQAMETVTRSFYARADLDLILSSPAPANRLFAVRICANAVTMIAMAAMFVGPIVDVAAVLDGPRFLCGYGVLVAMGSSALAVAVCVVALLFHRVGPKRTRLVAQIVAAIVGAGFVIWIQIVAIISYGSLSRTLMFRSPAWVTAAPDMASRLWWAARAAMGDLLALVLTLAAALGLLAAAVFVASPALARTAMAVAGLPTDSVITTRPPTAFRRRSQSQSLRGKEWTLLWRDPWLVSQSLMQILYLLPPALLLWRDIGTNTDSLLVLVPVLVMAAGQLAGGLAWLAISGEDAPDLVASAPIASRAILRAKTEAVMGAVALPIVPIALAMAYVAPFLAGLTIVGAACAAAGASAVQFFFRSQAKRSNFRRRQTSSRFATFAEAFLSISVAGAAGLAAAGLWPFALLPALIALIVVAASWVIAGQPTSV